MSKRPLIAAATVAAATGLMGTAPASTQAGPDVPTCHGKPATIVGTNDRDVYGTAKRSGSRLHNRDVLVLRGGRDLVNLYEGRSNLTICMGRDEDRVEFGESNGSRNLIDFGPGADKAFNTETDDFTPWGSMEVFGRAGADEIGTAGGEDRIEGGSGRDRLYGGDDDDAIFGGAGRDKLYGGGNSDHLHGGDGDDLLDGDSGYPEGTDHALGGPGTDECMAEIKRGCER